MRIARETLTDEVFTEIVPLAQKCWNESTEAKGETCAYHGDRDFEVEPDRDVYFALENKGALVLITLRDDEQLQGYVVGFVHKSMHHKKITCGFGDSIYVEHGYRGHTTALVNKFEVEMRELGVEIIGWPTHPGGPVYQVLLARGYVADDVVLEKRIT